jgi:hypothetical protein
MKQKFLLLTGLLLLVQVLVFAQFNSSRGYLPVVAEDGIDAIIVGDNIDVLLMPSGTESISAKVEDASIKKITAHVVDTYLYLTTTKKLAAGQRVTVYIRVNDLCKLVLKGNSAAASRGILNSRELKIVIDKDGTAALKTNGSISVVTTHKYEISKTGDYSYVYAAE